MNTEAHTRLEQQTEHRHRVNAHVGERVRLQRKNKGLSAANLGQALNVRYQQIHFYERGDNQLTSSTLYHLSQALDVPISFFFDGLSESDLAESASFQNIASGFADAFSIFSVKDIRDVEQEVKSLAGSFYNIEDKIVRKGIIEFLKVLGRRP